MEHSSFEDLATKMNNTEKDLYYELIIFLGKPVYFRITVANLMETLTEIMPSKMVSENLERFQYKLARKYWRDLKNNF